MNIVIGIFAITLALIVGVYWLVIEEPEIKEERALRRRLAPEQGAIVRPALVTAERHMSAFRWLDAVLMQFQRYTRPLEHIIQRAAVPITPGAVLLACVFVAVAVYTGLGYLTNFTALKAVFAVIAAPIPLWFVAYKAHKRMRKFEEQFPAAIDLVSRALRAGHALPTALEMVAQEVADPVGTEFRLLFERQNFGMSLEQALRAFAERIPMVDTRFFVTAVLTQREVGGNLSEILDNLAGVIRERFSVKREIRIASAHGRITGWVLAALPPVVAALLLIVAREHIMLLVQDPVGVRLVAMAVVLQIIGVLFIRKIIRVEY